MNEVPESIGDALAAFARGGLTEAELLDFIDHWDFVPVPDRRDPAGVTSDSRPATKGSGEEIAKAYARRLIDRETYSRIRERLAARRPAREDLAAIVTDAECHLDDLSRREERVSWWLHHAVALRLIETPELVLQVVPANVERMRSQVRGPAHEWLDEWELITSTDLAGTLRLMLGTTQHSIAMRQLGPFAGVLSEQERLAAVARAQLS